ncbi:hypothetical protein JCM10207_008919 [Rhodosporidiobolus poonsookiae]
MEPPDDLSDSEYLPEPSAVLPAVKPNSTVPPANLKQTTLTFNQTPATVYLPQLNPAQREAVTASREGGLAVHAGPGSGKTKVLTTRVAWLIQEGGIKPEELVVVTFTNKAANEMKLRLAKLVGAEIVDKVVMGTFHSVCVRYLRKYAALVGLPSNFLITDRDDCLAIIKRILLSDFVPVTLKREMKPQTWLESISRCKAKMQTPEAYRAERLGGGVLSPADEEKFEAIARVYEAYEAELNKANALDFDDLLLRGHELFQSHPRVVGKIRSVLIDEFQDTNTVQYDLVKLIAAASGSLTIVGDPDQSIYGWRNAEIENLEKMLVDFKPVKQVFLEQNYRSTGAILGAALAVVKQDTKRVAKSLHTAHPSGSSVVLHHAPSAIDEATFIASSIKHLVAHLGGLISYNDCAVLLRYGALSRAVETGLQRAGISSRMVGGHKFFERAEIKDMLSYLQVVSNPSYRPALERVVNVPRRGIGDKTVKEIFAAADRKNISAFEVLVKVVNGHEGLGLVKGLTAAQRKGVKSLVETVRDARKKADEGADVADLIDFVCEQVQYRQHLERTQAIDWAERWENVEELKSYATIVASENRSADLATEIASTQAPFNNPSLARTDENGVPFKAAASTTLTRRPDDDDSDDDFEIIDPDGSDEGEIEMPLSSQAATDGKTTPLEVFLATSMLATDTDTQDAKNDAKADKVTISTCHAAKGLEWPVVFIPACENGTYPFFRASVESEVDEERRLLYVAITRAQSFCFLSHANERMAGADTKKKDLSPFLNVASTSFPTLFVKKLQKITTKTREETAAVLDRKTPSEERVKVLVEEYNTTQPVEPVTFDPALHGSGSHGSRNYGSFGGGRLGGGFTSGSSVGRYNGNSLNSFGASQGRYGGTSGFTTGGGQSLGKWSNVSSSSQQAAPQPPSYSQSPAYSQPPSFSQALHTEPSKGPYPPTGLPAPPRKATTTAFKPPTMVNPTVPGRPPSTKPASSSTSSLPAPPRKRPADGPPGIVETRASIINEAVLVNPVLSAPGPSKSTDLLAAFESGARGELEAFKRFGREKDAAAETEDAIVLGSSSSVEEDPPPATGAANRAPPMSPQAKGKRAAGGTRGGAVAAKRGRKG